MDLDLEDGEILSEDDTILITDNSISGLFILLQENTFRNNN
jgi:hypothetical protein